METAIDSGTAEPKSGSSNNRKHWDRKSTTERNNDTSAASESNTLSEMPTVVERECRICREKENGSESLISPCNCRGSIAFIHKQCLKRCIETTRKVRCSICRGSYQHVDIQVRFHSVFQFALFNPAMTFFYVLSIGTLLGNQLVLMQQSVVNQHHLYQVMQIKLHNLRQLTRSLEQIHRNTLLPDDHERITSNALNQWGQHLDKQSKMPNQTKPVTGCLSSANCDSSPDSLRLNTRPAKCRSGAQNAQQDGWVKKAFQTIDRSEALRMIWNKLRSLIVNCLQINEQSRQPQAERVETDRDEWQKRMQEHLHRQQVNLVMQYITWAVYTLVREMMNMLSISLFIWYLWDSFRTSLAMWKAQNVHLQVIL